ncbi:unnamed protein product, partial [Amoebophrya sp. A25]|eukprot:GSA25T00006499001.1
MLQPAQPLGQPFPSACTKAVAAGQLPTAQILAMVQQRLGLQSAQTPASTAQQDDQSLHAKQIGTFDRARHRGIVVIFTEYVVGRTKKSSSSGSSTKNGVISGVKNHGGGAGTSKDTTAATILATPRPDRPDDAQGEEDRLQDDGESYDPDREEEMLEEDVDDQDDDTRMCAGVFSPDLDHGVWMKKCHYSHGPVWYHRQVRDSNLDKVNMKGNYMNSKEQTRPATATAAGGTTSRPKAGSLDEVSQIRRQVIEHRFYFETRGLAIGHVLFLSHDDAECEKAEVFQAEEQVAQARTAYQEVAKQHQDVVVGGEKKKAFLVQQRADELVEASERLKALQKIAQRHAKRGSKISSWKVQLFGLVNLSLINGSSGSSKNRKNTIERHVVNSALSQSDLPPTVPSQTMLQIGGAAGDAEVGLELFSEHFYNCVTRVPFKFWGAVQIVGGRVFWSDIQKPLDVFRLVGDENVVPRVPGIEASVWTRPKATAHLLQKVYRFCAYDVLPPGSSAAAHGGALGVDEDEDDHDGKNARRASTGSPQSRKLVEQQEMRAETAALKYLARGHTHNHDYYQFRLQPKDTELWQRWLRSCGHSGRDFFHGMLPRGLDGALLESSDDHEEDDDDEEKGGLDLEVQSSSITGAAAQEQDAQEQDEVEGLDGHHGEFLDGHGDDLQAPDQDRETPVRQPQQEQGATTANVGVVVVPVDVDRVSRSPSTPRGDYKRHRESAPRAKRQITPVKQYGDPDGATTAEAASAADLATRCRPSSKVRGSRARVSFSGGRARPLSKDEKQSVGLVEIATLGQKAARRSQITAEGEGIHDRGMASVSDADDTIFPGSSGALMSSSTTLQQQHPSSRTSGQKRRSLTHVQNAWELAGSSTATTTKTPTRITSSSSDKNIKQGLGTNGTTGSGTPVTGYEPTTGSYLRGDSFLGGHPRAPEDHLEDDAIFYDAPGNLNKSAAASILSNKSSSSMTGAKKSLSKKSSSSQKRSRVSFNAGGAEVISAATRKQRIDTVGKRLDEARGVIAALVEEITEVYEVYTELKLQEQAAQEGEFSSDYSDSDDDLNHFAPPKEGRSDRGDDAMKAVQASKAKMMQLEKNLASASERSGKKDKRGQTGAPRKSQTNKAPEVLLDPEVQDMVSDAPIPHGLKYTLLHLFVRLKRNPRVAGLYSTPGEMATAVALEILASQTAPNRASGGPAAGKSSSLLDPAAATELITIGGQEIFPFEIMAVLKFLILTGFRSQKTLADRLMQQAQLQADAHLAHQGEEQGGDNGATRGMSLNKSNKKNILVFPEITQEELEEELEAEDPMFAVMYSEEEKQRKRDERMKEKQKERQELEQEERDEQIIQERAYIKGKASDLLESYVMMHTRELFEMEKQEAAAMKIEAELKEKQRLEKLKKAAAEKAAEIEEAALNRGRSSTSPRIDEEQLKKEEEAAELAILGTTIKELTEGSESDKKMKKLQQSAKGKTLAEMKKEAAAAGNVPKAPGAGAPVFFGGKMQRGRPPTAGGQLDRPMSAAGEEVARSSEDEEDTGLNFVKASTVEAASSTTDPSLDASFSTRGKRRVLQGYVDFEGSRCDAVALTSTERTVRGLRSQRVQQRQLEAKLLSFSMISTQISSICSIRTTWKK